MSLWEKWEREKKERLGIEVERKGGVEIHDTRPKPDIRRQSLIVCGAVVACVVSVYFFWALHDRYGGHWSDFPMIRSITSIWERRIEEGVLRR